MSFKTRLFVILWLAGMAGVLSFLLVDLSKLIEILPVPAGTQLPSSIWVLKLLTLIQPTILLSLAVFVGVLLASKIGLSSPVAEAIAANREFGLKASTCSGFDRRHNGRRRNILKLDFLETISSSGVRDARFSVQQYDSALNSIALRRLHRRTAA